MAKKAKAVKPEPVVVVKTTPPNTSKRAVARLKVREAKHGSTDPRSSVLKSVKSRVGESRWDND